MVAQYIVLPHLQQALVISLGRALGYCHAGVGYTVSQRRMMPQPRMRQPASIVAAGLTDRTAGGQSSFVELNRNLNLT